MKTLLLNALILLTCQLTYAANNGCREGYSKAELTHWYKVSRSTDVRISQSRGEFILYASFSKARVGHRSASNTVSIESYHADYAVLEPVAVALQKHEAKAICVRPDQSSYYRYVQLPSTFTMQLEIMPGNSFELDSEQPYPVEEEK